MFTLQIKLSRLLRLAKEIEFEFIAIETRRQANSRRRIPGLETGALTAGNQLEFDVLGSFGKDAERDELIADHIVRNEFAILFGLPEHLHVDSLPLVWAT